MTTIQLMTSDQQLVAVGKVKLASGDVDSVWLGIDFDSAWDEFPARTATFYTSKNERVVEKLLVENSCIVPAEVLAESCTLFVGVRGITTDGTAIKTSSLVKYKVFEGAHPGYTTITPTMDLYRQYLAAMQAGIDPIFAQYKAEMEERYAEHEEEVTAEVPQIVAGLMGGYSKLVYGTYEGTGTNGTDQNWLANPTIIQCDVEPYLVAIYGDGSGAATCLGFAIKGSMFRGSDATNNIFQASCEFGSDFVKVGGLTAAYQANVSGKTYKYIIIGK